MKNKDYTVLIDGLRKLSADLTEIADQLSVNEEAKTVKEEAPPEILRSWRHLLRRRR